MSRFATLADSITGVATVGPVGFKDLNRGSRVLVQFGTSGDFQAVVKGTLDFDFQSNVGSNWFDMTGRLKLIDVGEPDEPGFQLFGGKWQHKKKDSADLPIGAPGVYAFTDGFIPAAVQFEVSTVSSGDNLKIVLGV